MFFLHLEIGGNPYFNCSNITNCKYFGVFSTSVFICKVKKSMYTVLYPNFSLLMSCAVFMSFDLYYDFYNYNLTAVFIPLVIFAISWKDRLFLIFHHY